MMKSFLAGRRSLTALSSGSRRSSVATPASFEDDDSGPAPRPRSDQDRFVFYDGFVSGFSPGSMVSGASAACSANTVSLIVVGLALDHTIRLRITDRHVCQAPGPVYHLLDLHWIGCDPTDPKALFVHWLKPRSSTKIMGAKVRYLFDPAAFAGTRHRRHRCSGWDRSRARCSGRSLKLAT